MAAHTTGADVLLVEDLGQQRLAARSLAAVLRTAGLSAHLARFGPDDDPDQIITLAQRLQPRLIVLSILFAHLVAENLALATRLRAADLAAHITMVCALPTFAYAQLLAACPALDSVLRGEAEAGLVHLAASLAHQTASLRDAGDGRDTPGLAYRSPDLRANPLPQPADALADLPFPARDDGIPLRLGFGFATLEASRGCYHTCAFCLPCAFYRAHPGPAYRLRSIPNLVEEIEALHRRGARLFLFDDEQFLPPGRLRARRVQALADGLEQRRLDIAFTLKCRADDVDEALFRQLQAMGLVRVYLGVESGCQATLDRLAKGVSVEGNARALATLDKLGIVADVRCLLLHPWSRLESVQADLAFWEQVLPHMPTPLTFHEVECYPGTALAGQLEAEAQARGVARLALDRDLRLAYTIADPRAELLRRLRRVVFGARDREQGLHQRISQAWYDRLLEQRFRPAQPATAQAGALREVVTRLNRESLAVWREMLAVVARGDVYDAERVNAHAAAWAGRMHTCDMRVAQEIQGLPNAGS